jgi:hypothetical protein
MVQKKAQERLIGLWHNKTPQGMGWHVFCSHLPRTYFLLPPVEPAPVQETLQCQARKT